MDDVPKFSMDSRFKRQETCQLNAWNPAHGTPQLERLGERMGGMVDLARLSIAPCPSGCSAVLEWRAVRTDAIALRAEQPAKPKGLNSLGDSGSEHVTGLTPTSAEPSPLSGTSTAHVLHKPLALGDRQPFELRQLSKSMIHLDEHYHSVLQVWMLEKARTEDSCQAAPVETHCAQDICSLLPIR
ncbi:uncharacterized protein PADG_07048 [Paracoccidioides brasiliensis Pb18]|uniref:Uncharacterized protein n=1 Tax=Paracoccidioides brasiliensis (strain Pb18) TaxID=502780 RepID=C1GIG2_PARBD|nr:uncharacterized protein PADG_07048 [Paracoccidioides brasiliensis Pb18]EEH42228.2 hypothetical protein PADG_07048 [Paracoccidioides brasiliensis Pb18]